MCFFVYNVTHFPPFLQEQVTRLLQAAEPGTDLDVRVIEAYLNESQAEAQEVTIARAIELKHSPQIVAGLCTETCKLFKLAGWCTGIDFGVVLLTEKHFLYSPPLVQLFNN